MSMLSWHLAIRFRQGKQNNQFISFISLSSTLGIGLGCCILIVLLSVMNGFEHELEQRLLSLIPHGELYSVSQEGIENWQVATQQFIQDPRIKNAQPYAKMTGMLQLGNRMKAVDITGLATDKVEHNTIFKFIEDDVISRFETTPNAVILGQSIVKQLGLTLGDRVQLLIPSVTQDLSFQAPQTLWLTLVGTFTIGGELDAQIGFIPLPLAIDKLNVTHGAQGIRFELNDPFNAREVMRDIGYSFNQAVYISDWTRTQGHLYSDIQLVRVIVYIALILVIAVACFNIVSGLVMTVEEKRAAIGILKTMGLKNKTIRLTFVLQGFINGSIGILVGSVLGVILAKNLANLLKSLESILGTSFLSGDIYFVNFLPSQLYWPDVFVTAGSAFVLCIIATLYPAAKAARVTPVQALNG